MGTPPEPVSLDRHLVLVLDRLEQLGAQVAAQAARLEESHALLAAQAELIERFRPLLDQLGSKRGAAYVAMGWGRGRPGA
jgi:uncharacterized coiled-coil protein SlyX